MDQVEVEWVVAEVRAALGPWAGQVKRGAGVVALPVALGGSALELGALRELWRFDGGGVAGAERHRA